MHALAAVQDTPPSVMFVAPDGRAMARGAQVVPFHARVTEPTATQEAAAVHDTAFSGEVTRFPVTEVPTAPRGLGDAWMAHSEPCRASASVRQAPG